MCIGLGCLTPLSTIFQLHPGDNLYWWNPFVNNQFSTSNFSEILNKSYWLFMLKMYLFFVSHDNYGPLTSVWPRWIRNLTYTKGRKGRIQIAIRKNYSTKLDKPETEYRQFLRITDMEGKLILFNEEIMRILTHKCFDILW
jgi:hypothetical protein